MKQYLCSAPTLAYPHLDKPFILQTDESNVDLGAVLTQLDDFGREQVVYYANHTLIGREK